jgi:AcrR family transcriptional regulator
METRPGGERPRRRGRDTRERILREAACLFATRGFGGASARDIAAACGVSDAALFYHFSSKQAMLDELAAGICAAVRSIPPADATVAAAVHAAAATVREPMLRPHVARALFRSALEDDRGVIETLGRLRVALVRAVRPIVEPLVGAQAAPVAEAVVLVLAGAILEAMVESGDHFEDEVREPAFVSRLEALARLSIVPALEPAELVRG